jgi:uncharacterized membrane protein (DUF2068 family)
MRRRRSRAARRPKQNVPARSRDRGLLLIAGFKLFKGLLLLATGIGALSLLHENVAAQARHLVDLLRVDPDNRYIHALLRRLLTVDDRKLTELSIGTFFYAAILGTEGTGLLLRKHWAEYFTIIATGAFIPLELYELIKHFTLTKIAVIAINVAVVWYLILRVRRRKLEVAHSRG